MPQYRMRLRPPPFRGDRTPVVRREHSAARLVSVGVVAATGLVPLWWWTTQTVDGQRMADLILYGRVVVEPAAAAAASETLGLVSVLSAIVATASVAVIAAVRGDLPLAGATLVIIAGANVTTQLLKRTLERPDLLGSAAYATGNSFPSGHVTLVASILFAIILIAPRPVRTWTAMTAAVASVAVGASTIVLGWHRLADVVGGMGIALAWAAMVSALLVLLQGRVPRRTWSHGQGGAVTAIATAIGALAVVIGSVALLIDAIDTRTLVEIVAAGPAEPRTFLAAVLVATGTAAIGFSAYVWAMRGVAVDGP